MELAGELAVVQGRLRGTSAELFTQGVVCTCLIFFISIIPYVYTCTYIQLVCGSDSSTVMVDY